MLRHMPPYLLCRKHKCCTIQYHWLCAWRGSVFLHFALWHWLYTCNPIMGNLVDMYSAPYCPCTWSLTVSVDMHCGTVNLCCIHSNSVNNTICYNAFKSYLATDHTVVICSCFLNKLCKFVLVSCYIVYFCTRNSCK